MTIMSKLLLVIFLLVLPYVLRKYYKIRRKHIHLTELQSCVEFTVIIMVIVYIINII